MTDLIAPHNSDRNYGHATYSVYMAGMHPLMPMARPIRGRSLIDHSRRIRRLGSLPRTRTYSPRLRERRKHNCAIALGMKIPRGLQAGTLTVSALACLLYRDGGWVNKIRRP